MTITYKATIKIGQRENKSGKYSILIRVSMNRRSVYLNMNEKIESRYWSGVENKWVKEAYNSSYLLNSLIRQKLADLRDFELKQKVFKADIDLDKISLFFKRKGDPNLVKGFIDNFIRTVRGKALNTIKVYKTFQNHFHAFRPDVTFDNLTEKFIQEFAVWMNTEKNLAGKTVHKMTSVLSLICKQAEKEGYLQRDPFHNMTLQVKVIKPKRVYLEVEEIQAIKNAVLPADRPDLEVTRRHWLFCFYAGFYYSDLKALIWENVKKTEVGYSLVYSRFKNENTSVAPLHKFKHAIQILEEQKRLDSYFVFPDTISEQKYNGKLKDLAKEAKIKKSITNKSARHSSAQFWVAQGLEVSHAAKIFGHNDEKTTKHYYGLSPNDVNSRVAKFDFTTLDL